MLSPKFCFTLNLNLFKGGGTETQFVELLPRGIRDSDLILTSDALWAEFAHSTYDCVGYLQVLQIQPHTIKPYRFVS